MNIEKLIAEAIKAKENAYSPYSNFPVGAALLSENENIYLGCNVENAAYSPSVCAERVAFQTAITAGERKFIAIAIISGTENNEEDKLDYCFPCGVCRQVMYEFCSNDFQIVVAKSKNDYSVYTLSELLPHGFGPRNLINNGINKIKL